MRSRVMLVGAAVGCIALAGAAGSVAKPFQLAAKVSRSWHGLPAAPIGGRIAASAVWTGKEMIVWGGVRREPLSDGAAYDPVTRTWRALAKPPAGVLGDGGSAAAWTGHGMLVWVGNSPDGPFGAAVYLPGSDSWRQLPSGPLGVRDGYVSVWTGSELLIVGGNGGDAPATPTAAVLDPRTSSWRVLKSMNTFPGFIPTGAVWNGHEAFLGGTAIQSHGRQPLLLAVNPRADAVRRIDLPVTPIANGRGTALKPIAWTGREVLFASSADPLFASTELALYNPTTRNWRDARAAPHGAPARSYSQLAWIGDRLVAPSGTRALQIYSPRSNSWHTIRTGASPLNSRGWSAIVWTGRELIVWGGTVRKPGMPMPANGASITLPLS